MKVRSKLSLKHPLWISDVGDILSLKLPFPNHMGKHKIYIYLLLIDDVDSDKPTTTSQLTYKADGISKHGLKKLGMRPRTLI